MTGQTLAKVKDPAPGPAFQKLSSIDFQSQNTNIHRRYGPSEDEEELSQWLAHAATGVSMGFIAWFLDVLVDNLASLKWQVAQGALDDSLSHGYASFVALSCLFGAAAGGLTVYYGPGAMGSGIAELIGYLNGVRVPNFIGVRSLVTKVFGTGLGVAGGLFIGKEGPLAHIGAVVGNVVVHLPFDFTKPLQSETRKRELAAAGAAAGVSAAFGAPIGGSLFAYEISRPSTFWSFGLTWKIFFCSSVSTFTLNVLQSIQRGETLSSFNSALVKFGEFDQNPFALQEFPLLMLLAAFAGGLGAIFS